MSKSIHILPFQKEAIESALVNKKMLINLPTGSGKTLVSLQVAARSKAQRVLVITPAFLKLNYIYELNKWYPKYWAKVSVVKKVKDATEAALFENIFAVVGYPFFETKGQTEYLAKQHWDLVICDESSYLRKWESRRCKNIILKVARKAERLLFLTATPLVTSAADLHPTFSIMQPGKWGKYSEFCDHYCNKVRDIFNPRGFHYEGINEANAFELRSRSRSFIFSRKKSVVLSQLPPKQVIDVPIECGKFKHFDEDISVMIDRLADGEESEEVKTERERIGQAKIKSVLELLETIPSNESVVIFAWHRSVVLEILKKYNHSCAIIGGMAERMKMDTVERFTKGEFKHLIVSIAAGGMGLNLQKASYAIFAELPYSYAEFEQASDRVWRIGSEKRVRIYKVIAINSLDEDINRVIESKREAAYEAGVLT